MTKQREMAQIACKAIDDKKGQDIKIIDISEISIMADYFVVASGSSSTQIQALVRNVEENLHKAGYVMKRMEGDKNSSWVLLDFGDVVVHVFNREDRLFYDLERIWSDGKIITPEEL